MNKAFLINNSHFIDSLIHVECNLPSFPEGSSLFQIGDFESSVEVRLMNRKLVWLSMLSILFLIWGASGSAAASHKQFSTQSTFPQVANAPVSPNATQTALIPVTGNPRLGWGTLLFYGLIGLATLTLILALLDSANQSTALYARRKRLQEDDRT
jgi:hypothetical protein